MTSALTPGMWVIFKSTGDEDQPFLLSRTQYTQKVISVLEYIIEGGENTEQMYEFLGNGMYKPIKWMILNIPQGRACKQLKEIGTGEILGMYGS
eukprot:3584453-Ditylum_brightwellii.AAC.1